jgi:hypothetical protein
MRATTRRTRGRLTLVLALLGVVGADPRAGAQKGLEPFSVTALLESYMRGDATAAARFATQVDKGKAVRAFEDEGRRWAPGPGKRHLIAAAFALDVSQRWMGTDDWRWGREMLGWTCGQLASTPLPDPIERLWHLAAIALIEGSDDWLFLTGRLPNAPRPAGTGRNATDRELLQGHLTHAIARFPDEPRFRLAAVVAADTRAWEIGGFGRDLNTRNGIIAGEIDRDYLDRLKNGQILADDGSRRSVPGATHIAEVHLNKVGDLRQVAARYAELTRDQTVAPEAQLRAGLVAYRLADRAGALQHFQKTLEDARDPYLVFLANLFSGVVREREGDSDTAIEDYWAALNVVPRAQSATSLLIARLINTGQQKQASAVADGFFMGGEVPSDPWRTYRLGDFRLFPVYLAQLRAALR